MFINTSLFLTAVALFSSLATTQATPYSATLPASSSPSSDPSTKTGWSGTLSTLSGGLSGKVTVLIPTTLQITNFKLADAAAPALYWWGSTSSSLKGGFRVSNTQVKESSQGGDIVVTLDAGKTVADFTTFGLWCERFGVNFGQAVLSPDGGSVTGAAATGTSSPQAGAGTALAAPLRAGVWAGVLAIGWLVFV